MTPSELEDRAIANIKEIESIHEAALAQVRNANAVNGQLGNEAQLGLPDRIMFANTITQALSALAQIRQYRVLNSAVELAGALGKKFDEA